MKSIMVGVGGFALSNTPGDIIKTMALGSCVGVVVVALPQMVVGLLHVALPDSKIDMNKALKMPGYFADTGIKAMLSELKKHGVNGSSELIVKLTGGANVMDPKNLFNIGKRNVLSIRKLLWQNRLAPRAEDVGGTFSRTVWVERDTGKVFISSPGKGQWEV